MLYCSTYPFSASSVVCSVVWYTAQTYHTASSRASFCCVLYGRAHVVAIGVAVTTLLGSHILKFDLFTAFSSSLQRQHRTVPKHPRANCNRTRHAIHKRCLRTAVINGHITFGILPNQHRTPGHLVSKINSLFSCDIHITCNLTGRNRTLIFET